MILDAIVKDKREHVEQVKSRRYGYIVSTETAIKARAERSSLVARLTSDTSGSRIIAEVKRRSPSGGSMNLQQDYAAIIQGYERAGAVAISVLTDEKYFGGSLDDLSIAREHCGLPLLRKDFIIDEYQIAESAEAGADVILLIAAILNDATIEKFIRIAHSYGLEVLLESHTYEEFRRALDSDADILGINNRNLDTLVTDIETSNLLLQYATLERPVISESGIKTRADIELLEAAGANGFLIGESLLKHGNPSQKLAELVCKSIPIKE